MGCGFSLLNTKDSNPSTTETPCSLPQSLPSSMIRNPFGGFRHKSANLSSTTNPRIIDPDPGKKLDHNLQFDPKTSLPSSTLNNDTAMVNSSINLSSTYPKDLPNTILNITETKEYTATNTVGSNHFLPASSFGPPTAAPPNSSTPKYPPSTIVSAVSNPLFPPSSASSLYPSTQDPLDTVPETSDGFKPDYKLGTLLGKGSFGNVYSASHRKTGDTNYAIKIMDRNRIKSSSIYREYMVLEHIGTEPHPGVVNYYATYKTKRDVSFVFELMSGGELFDRLVSFGVDNEYMVREAFRPVIEGLAYLHSKGIVHRDIKPENLLLKIHPPSSNDVPILKIADFGLSQLINPNERLLKICGTAPYSAPEMFQPDKPGYDLKFDCFSMGVVLYVALVGYHPFDPNGTSAVIDIKARARNVTYDFSGNEWTHISDTGKDLIRRLIIKDPEQRLDSKMILQHRWFRQDTVIPPTVLTHAHGYASTVTPSTGPVLQTKDTDGATEILLPSTGAVVTAAEAVTTVLTDLPPTEDTILLPESTTSTAYVAAGGVGMILSMNRLERSLTHVDGLSVCEGEENNTHIITDNTMDIDYGTTIPWPAPVVREPATPTFELLDDSTKRTNGNVGGSTSNIATGGRTTNSFIPPPIDTTLPKNVSQITMSDVSYPYPSPFTSSVSSVSTPSSSRTTGSSLTASTIETGGMTDEGAGSDTLQTNYPPSTTTTTKVSSALLPTVGGRNESRSLRNQTKSLSPRHASYSHYIDASDLPAVRNATGGTLPSATGTQQQPHHHHHHHHHHRHHHYPRIHHRLTFVPRIHPYCSLCSKGFPLHAHACLSRYPTYSGPSDGRSTVTSLPGTSPTNNLVPDTSIPNNLHTLASVTPRTNTVPIRSSTTMMEIAETTFQGPVGKY